MTDAAPVPGAELGTLKVECGSLAKWVLLRRRDRGGPQATREEICALMAPAVHRAVRGDGDRPGICYEQQEIRIPAGQYEAQYVALTWDDAEIKRCDSGYRTWSASVTVEPNKVASLELRPLSALELYGGMHCPHAAFVGKGGTVGQPFVLLDNRQGSALAGIDRIKRQAVTVRDGLIVLRVQENEPEISHIDSLTLEVNGRIVAPRPPLHPPWVLREGDALELAFEVPWLSAGEVDVTVVVAGYYTRL